MTSRPTVLATFRPTPCPHRHRRRARAALVTVAAVVATACGTSGDPADGAADSLPPPSPGSTAPPAVAPPPTGPTTTSDPLRYDAGLLRDELAAARARWAASGVSFYRLTQTPVCFCEPEAVTAEVFAGRVVDRDGPVEARSVEEWFDVIDAEIGAAADVRATYHSESGYPTSVHVDVSDQIADEEYGVVDVELTPIHAPLSELTSDTYPCGFGFWAATPDQTVAVMIGIPIGDDVDGEPEPGTYDFTVLIGELRFGTDLMANWCDDVLEEGEPTPAVDDTWRIVAGSLDVTLVDGAGVPSATATLTDVVAVDGDGIEHSLGDATITNAAWGVVAG